MTELMWDAVGSRRFESGLNRGVLYPNDAPAVVWNGLVAVDETLAAAPSPLYLDGLKFGDRQNFSDYSAKLNAFTYPDELNALTGTDTYGSGLQINGQRSRRFSLSYRTGVGTDVVGANAGSKIHLVYNALATPSGGSYGTTDSNTSPITFEWQLDAIPVRYPGIRPTAHFVVDTTVVGVDELTELEAYLYGTSEVDAAFPTVEQLFDIFAEGPRPDPEIDEDGGWTMTGDARFFTMSEEDTAFSVRGVPGVLTGDTYAMESH